jgi:protein-S-isoprenylcysteine O-methyltransferase Ste14
VSRAGLYLRASVAMVLPVIVDILVPVGFTHGSGGRFHLGAVRYLGLPLIVAGAWLLLDSVFLRFAHEGRGTLAPLDPPKFVVRGGAYRVVRNPMYVANIAVLVGIAVVFRSWRVLAWTGVVFTWFHLFTVFYEEPTLRRLFGDDYAAYTREVGRWLPRRR